MNRRTVLKVLAGLPFLRHLPFRREAAPEEIAGSLGPQMARPPTEAELVGAWSRCGVLVDVQLDGSGQSHDIIGYATRVIE